MKEVVPQLTSKDKFILFKHEIPDQIKIDVIYAILLSVKPTEEIITTFTPFLISDDNLDKEKMNKFARKASDEGLVVSLLISILSGKKDNDHPSTSDLINESNIIRDNFDEDEVTSNFLKCANPESNDTVKKSLFKKMISEKSNLLGYLQMIFENINGPTIEPRELLRYYKDEYEISKDDFVQVLNNVLVLHPSEKVFIEKVDYKPLNLQDSEFNRKIINRLFEIVTKDPSNYQACYCLELIAVDFPFIFSLNPIPLFEALLPSLDNFKLVFEEKTDDEEIEKLKVNRAKASIAAVSALLFSLNSTKVMDCFVEWFFNNSEMFTLSQVLCFIYVFISISSTNCLQYLTALFMKYRMFECFSKFLLKEVPKSLFGKNFNCSLYSFLKIQHVLDEALSTLEAILIDPNSHRDNLMYEVSGKHLTHSQFFFSPIENKLLYMDSKDEKKLNKEPLEFIDVNRGNTPSWVMKNREHDCDVSSEEVDEFLHKYDSLVETKPVEASSSYLPDIPNDITTEKVKMLATKNIWVIKYLLFKEKFPLLDDHYEILKEAIKEITDKEENDGKKKEEKKKRHLSDDDNDDDDDDEEDNDDDDDDDDDDNDDDDENSDRVKDFKKEKYFRTYREDKTFIKNLIARLPYSMFEPVEKLGLYFKSIPINSGDHEIVFTTIKSIFDIIDAKYGYLSGSAISLIQILVVFVATFLQNQLESKSVDNEDFTKAFFNLVGNDLINFILKPQYRENKFILKMVYRIFSLLKDYPIRTIHLIGFMFLIEDEYFRKAASKMCLRFDNEDLSEFALIDDIFVKEISSDKPNLPIISNILRSSSKIGNSHRRELADLLNESLEKYQDEKREKGEEEEEDKKDDDDEDDDECKDAKLKDIIIQLLDFLAPDRNEEQSFSLTDSLVASKRSHNEQFRFCPIPNYIYDKAPVFWDIFEKYRLLINGILLKKFRKNTMLDIPGFIGLLLSLAIDNFSSRFVSNYPELFSYDFRSTFFHQLVHEDIRFYDDTELKFESDENIFENSFKQLHDKSPKEWRNRICVEYKGQSGIGDGLTKDWMTQLSNAIFSPQLELFEVSEKNLNISPSRSIYAQSQEGLAKLKLAGMLVARALMQGFLLPVHLTKPFLKQILHHGSKITFSDLQDADEDIYNSLLFYKDYDFDSNPSTDVRFESYQLDGSVFEMIENGSQTRVNNGNKGKYIELMTEYRLKKSVEKQVKAFCDGFDSLIPHEKIRMFTPTELCLLICGVPKIDVDDLRNNVEYKGSYNENSPVIKLFFETIKKWDDDNLAKLLVFITGTSRMPANGFAYFKEMDNPIKIDYGGDRERLPCAHTCMNTLDLPEYENEDEMNFKLLDAIKVSDFQIK